MSVVSNSPTRGYHECDCDCHAPGSSILHFEPCCCGYCPACGRHFVGLAAHYETEHGGPLPSPFGGGPTGVSKRRKKRKEKR